MRALKSVDLPLLLWTVITAAGLLAPRSSLSSVGRFPDWAPAAAHFVLFLVMAALVGRRFYVTGRAHPLSAAVAVAFGYGFLLEVAQTRVRGRYFEAHDLLLNGFGCLVGAALVGLWMMRRSTV